MPFRKGHQRIAGRVAGTPNKLTLAAREAIALAAYQLGGARRLVEWARATEENEKTFWSVIYPKLLPTVIRGSGEDGAIPLSIDIDPLEIMRQLEARGLPGVLYGTSMPDLDAVLLHGLLESEPSEPANSRHKMR